MKEKLYTTNPHATKQTKLICRFFIGCNNQLYGVQHKQDIVPTIELLEDIHHIHNLPVFRVEQLDQNTLIFYKIK